MNFRITWGKYIVYNAFVSIMAYIIISSITGYFNLKPDTPVILGTASGVNFFLYLVYAYPVFGLFVPALVLASGSVYYIVEKEKFISLVQGLLEKVNNSLLWFAEYAYSNIGVNPLYSKIIIISAVVIITIILFYLVVVRGYTLISMASGVAVFSVMWFMGYQGAFYFMQLYVFASLLLFGFVNYEDLENRWKIKKDVFSRKIPAIWAACILSAMAIVFVLAGMIPGRSGYLDYGWFNDRVLNRVVDKWNKAIDENAFSQNKVNEKFDISSVGFSEKPSKLGGAVRASNVLLLKVKTEGSVKTPVYLRGTINSTYTGSTWTEKETKSYINNDNMEIGKLLGSAEKVKKAVPISMTIYPQAIDTATLFNLWRPYKFDIYDKTYNYDDDGEVYLNKLADRRTEYTVVSLTPSVYIDELRTATDASKNIEMKKYLELPETISDRVRSLSLKITDKYRNSYDKAAAIEQYLRQNYPYTLTPPSVPEGKDFVDYFLFEGKQGYCTYFASSMAVLCRAAGIPSRYVEGVVFDSTDLDSQGFYNVMSNKAHAWVEVYFEGYGWMKFEPTSSYSAANYSRTEQSTVVPQESKPAQSQNNLDTDNTKQDSQAAKETNKGKSMPFYLYIIFSVVFIIAGRIALKFYLSSRSLSKAERLTGKYAAIEYMNILEKKLKLGGITREDHETPREFGQRVDLILSPHGIDIKDIVNCFDGIRFGNAPVNTGARRKFRHAIDNIDNFIKHRKGKMKYIFFKYML